jgi:hypothetical protein
LTPYDIWKQVPQNLTSEQAQAANAQATIGGQDPTAPISQSGKIVCGYLDFTCQIKRFFMWLTERIVAFFGLLLWLAASALDVALSLPKLLGGFTTSPVVTTGWPIIRDLANMFFSLILLVIAFATILRIESYGMKQVLWRLVVAALLINFSLVIAGVIIDGSNTLTSFFVQGNYTNTQGQPMKTSEAIMNGLKLSTLYDVNGSGLVNSSVTTVTPQIDQTKIQGEIGFGNIFVNMILMIIFILVASFVLFVAAILFFIRMVALWILLIFAPLAWLAMILPATRSMWTKWWHEFMKWIIFAPVYAFFLYLTISIINNGLLERVFAQNAVITDSQGLLISSFLSNFNLIINYIIIMIFMLAGLIFSRQSGIIGAATFANFASSVGKGSANFIGRAADRFLAEGAEKTGWQGVIRKPLSYLSPTAWKMGLQRRKAQRDREAFEVSGAARQDSINRFWGGPKKWFKGGSEMQEYRERAKRSRRQAERREIVTNNAEELVAGFEKAKKEKNYGKMSAYAQALSEQNDFNELLRYYAATGKDGLWEMSAEGLEDFTKNVLMKEAGMNEQDSLRLGYDLMRMHENNGQWLGRIIKYDAATDSYSWEGEGTDDDGTKLNKYDNARRNATIEWSKQDPQAQARTTGRFCLIKEGYQKGTGATIDRGLTNAGRRMISTIGGEHANRLQRNTRNVIMLNHANEVQEFNPNLYNKAVAFYQDTTDEMTDEQYANYVTSQQTFVGTKHDTGKKGTPVWGQKKASGTRPQNPPPNVPWS